MGTKESNETVETTKTLTYFRSMNNLLEIKNVAKRFESVVAVKDISLNIPRQSIFGLLGPNGAGKTTLIRMITNIVPADSGSILMNGEDNPTKRMYQIGYMPEERGLYKKMKVGEHLLYLAQLKNYGKSNAKEQVNWWLKRFDIEDWWNKKVQDLSKGMQQKIQFISTVIHQPELIILDEPFSGLDPLNTNLIRNEIDALRERGATVIFSTHRMEQVEQVCEHIALINQGEKILEGTMNGVKQQFKKNLFAVEFMGSLPDLTDSPFGVERKGDQNLEIQIQQGQHPNEVLAFLLEKQVEVHAFQEILPSINEIFIERVSGSTES